MPTTARPSPARCFGLVTLLAMLAIAAAGHVRAAEHARPETPDRAIHVGMVNGQTGAVAPIGRAFDASARAVFDDVNARGGIHGRQLVLHTADDGYEPEQTVDQTLRLIQQEKVVALLGFIGTNTTNAVQPLLTDFDIPLVGVFSGGRSLRQPTQRQMFHFRPSYAQEADALVDRLARDGATRIAVLYQNDAFGADVLRGVQRALEQRGLPIAASAGYQRGTVAIQMPLAAIVAARPDAVIMAATDPVSFAFMGAARSAGLHSRFASVSSFNPNEHNVRALSDSGEQLLLSEVVPLMADNGASAVAECRRILARYSEEALSFVAFEGCINARILVSALQRAGANPSGATIRQSLESTHRIDLDGLDVSYSSTEHQAHSEVYLMQVADGRIRSAQ